MLPWTNGTIAENKNSDIPGDWFSILVTAIRNLIRPQTLLVALLLLTYGIHQSLNETTETLFAIRQLGWSQSEFSSMAAIFNIVFGVFCIALGGWFVDRFGPGRIAFWSGAAAMPIMAVYLLDETLWESDSLFVVWYFVKGAPLLLFYLANLVLAMRVTPSATAATSLSVLLSIGTMGLVIASAILPTLEEIGGYQAMFGTSAALVFVAGSISLLLSKEVRLPAATNAE